MNNSGIINPNIPEKPEAMPTPTSTNPNKWLKVGLLGLVGLLAVVGLVYAGYWYGRESEKLKAQSEKLQLKTEKLTPNRTQAKIPTLIQDSTFQAHCKPGWRLFTNSINNYQFCYPKDWNYTEGAEGCGPGFTPAELSELFDSDNLTICFSANYTPEELIRPTGVIREEITEITIDGHRAVKLTTKSDNTYFVEIDVGNHRNHRGILGTLQIVIAYEPGVSPKQSKYYQTFDQMLSTFKFLD